jgi:hypothetical protein
MAGMERCALRNARQVARKGLRVLACVMVLAILARNLSSGQNAINNVQKLAQSARWKKAQILQEMSYRLVLA